MRRTISLCGAAALLAACCCAAARNDTLTVSGISAGGAFAVQYHVARSSVVRGAGIIAGLPYYCATDVGLMGATSCMEDPLLIDLLEIDVLIQAAVGEGTIDPTSNLQDDAVMLFSGTIDTVVSHGSMELLQTQYQGLGVKKVISYFNYTAEHAWITNFYGNSCFSLGSPYINNCGLDFAGEFLRLAFERLRLPFNESRGQFNPSNLKQFSQTAFGASGLLNSMDSVGYYYVPSACQGRGSNGTSPAADCHVHVSFHGCSQGQSFVGTTFVSNAGLNEWAETNNVIVVYPQIAGNFLESNPEGCFDWWGYTGMNYANKQGTQVQIVDAIVKALFDSPDGRLPSP